MRVRGHIRKRFGGSGGGKVVTHDLLSGKQSSRPAPKGSMVAQSDSFEVVEYSKKKPQSQRVVLGGKMDFLVGKGGYGNMVRKIYKEPKPKKRKRSKPMGRSRGGM